MKYVLCYLKVISINCFGIYAQIPDIKIVHITEMHVEWSISVTKIAVFV